MTALSNKATRAVSSPKHGLSPVRGYRLPGKSNREYAERHQPLRLDKRIGTGGWSQMSLKTDNRNTRIARPSKTPIPPLRRPNTRRTQSSTGIFERAVARNQFPSASGRL